MHRLVLCGILAAALGIARAEPPEHARPSEQDGASDAVAAGGGTLYRTHWRASTFTLSAQMEAALDVSREGEIVAVWTSRRQNGGRSGVFGQSFTADGVAVGAETALGLSGEPHQREPDVAVTRGGDAWMVWNEHGRDGDRGSIVSRRFDRAEDHATPNGLLARGGPELVVNQFVQGHQFAPVIAAFDDEADGGRFAVAWTSEDSQTQRLNVRARLFDFSGAPLSDEISIGAPRESQSRTPGIAFGRDGTLAVVFAAAGDDSKPAGIALQRFSATGDPIGAAVAVAREVDAAQIEPVIAASGFGYVVAWAQADQSSEDYFVVAQRLDGQGLPLGEPARLSEDSAGYQNAVALAVDSADGYAALWNETSEGRCSVRAQLFSSAGERMGGAFSLTTMQSGNQALTEASAARRLVFTHSGALLAAWAGDGNCGDATGVHVSMVAASSPAADVARGVTAEMLPASPARSDVAAAKSSDDAARQTASPHEPPTFDPRRIAPREPEILEGANVIGFTGIVSTGWDPPDPSLAVGPGHIVVMTNGAIAFLDKTGTLLFQDAIEGAGGFWGPLGATNFVFDPEVLYDPLSQRFFAMASEANAPGGSFVLVAVSDDSDPNGQWHKYRFSTTALAGNVFDSPNIAVDASVVYITGDAGGGYPIFIFNKAPLLSGQPTAIQHSLTLPTSTQSAGIPPVSFDNPPALYMAEHAEGGTVSTVRLIALTNALTAPTLTTMTVTVPSYNAPEDPPQMGTTLRPESFDARFWSVAYRNGSLWATHHAGSTRVLARWYQFAMNGWPTSGNPPALVQTGIIDPGAGIRTFFSAITVDDDGDATIVCARSATTEFISMVTAHRRSTDALGFFQPVAIRKVSIGPYISNPPRWGDYAGVNVDPADDQTVWATHEFVQNNSWRTWITGFEPLIPANDLCANAAVVTDGATSFSNVGANTDGPDEPALCSFGGSSNVQSDVWFRYTAACTGAATVSFCNSASLNTKVAIYGPSCPSAPGEALACNDSSCGDDASVTFDVVAGGEYLIRAGGFQNAQGAATMLIACEPAATCAADVFPIGGGDGIVGPGDVGQLLSNWGACPAPCPEDLAPVGKPDGIVGPADLAQLLASWGPC